MASNVLHQVMSMSSNHALEEALSSCSKQQQQQQQQEQQGEQERRARPQAEQALQCPRCDSANTKFCYYNNYSLAQPRYFCKGCRRYWTQGGTLRNVPVGGGCRKNKRPSPSSPLLAPCKRLHEHQQQQQQQQPPPLAFHPDHATFSGGYPSLQAAPSFLDILRGGFLDAGACCFQQGGGGHEMGGGVPVLEGAGGEVKHEPCVGGDEAGAQYYWLQGGGDGGVLADPVRDYYWGGLAAAAAAAAPWHGLVNSSLM